MAEKFNPVLLSDEEAAKIDASKIGKGVAAEGEVEAQGYTITCSGCGQKYWNQGNYQYTICPYCGKIMQWW